MVVILDFIIGHNIHIAYLTPEWQLQKMKKGKHMTRPPLSSYVRKLFVIDE